MTAVVHHGFSGSYKSFAIVQRIIIPALIGVPVLDSDGKKTYDENKNVIFKGRTVVTNIRGLNSIENIEDALDVNIHPDSKIIYVDPDGGKKSWDLMRVWFHWAPIGALIALDETAKIYSMKRIKDLKIFDLPIFKITGERNTEEFIKHASPHWDGNFERPEDLETAIDMHRHYHWDLYYSCVNITKLHKELRDNLEAAYRHKPMGTFLPWKKNCWKEFNHDSSTDGKSINNYRAPPKSYKADLRIFNCYLSTKDGKAKLSPENNNILRNPKFIAICLAFVAVVFYVTHSANNLLSSDSVPIENAQITNVNNSQVPDNANIDGLPRPVDSPGASPSSLKTPLLVQDVLALPMGYRLSDSDRFTHYLGGDFKIYVPTFVKVQNGFHMTINIEQNGNIIDTFTAHDIELFGYQINVTSNGFEITRKDKQFYITRESPTFQPLQLQEQEQFPPDPILKNPQQTSAVNGFFQ